MPTIDQQLEELTRPTKRAYERGRRDAVEDRNLEDVLGLLGIATVVSGTAVSGKEKMKQAKDAASAKRLFESAKNYPEIITRRRAVMQYKMLVNNAIQRAKKEMYEMGYTDSDFKNYPSAKKTLSRKVAEELAYYNIQGADAIGGVTNPHGKNMFVKEALQDTVLNKIYSDHRRKSMGMIKEAPLGIRDYRDRMLNRVYLQELLNPKELGTDTYYHQRKTGAPVTLVQDYMENLSTNEPKRMSERRKELKEFKKGMLKRGVSPEDMHGGNIGRSPVDGRLRAIDVGHSRATKLSQFLKKKDLKKIEEAKNVVSKANKKMTMEVAKDYAKRWPGELGRSLPKDALKQKIANRSARAIKKVGKVLGKSAGGLGAAANLLIEPSDEIMSFLPAGKIGSSMNIAQSAQEAIAHIMGPGKLGSGELPPEEMKARELFNRIQRQKAYIDLINNTSE